MRYKLFGRSGLRVSELCLGTMTFGQDWGWGADVGESKAMFDTFVKAGGNFIDTAHLYTEGTSEKLLGQFIASDRDHFVIASKYTPTSSGDIGRSGNSLKNMRRCVEDSLSRMKTDHIDIYWLHWWDNTTPVDEIMRGFDDLVSSGKITYIAVSNTPAWQISRANMLADLRGWAPFIGLQTEYNLIERTAERELLPMAKELDLGITAWSPLAGGVLSGKYDDRTETTVGRKQLISPRQREISKLVVEIAREIGRSPSQVALAAIRQQRKFGAIIPILGARNHKQFVDNMGCLDLTLEVNHLRRLDQATAVPLGSPHEFLSSPHILHNAYGGHYDLLDNHRV